MPGRRAPRARARRSTGGEQRRQAVDEFPAWPEPRRYRRLGAERDEGEFPPGERGIAVEDGAEHLDGVVAAGAQRRHHHLVICRVGEPLERVRGEALEASSADKPSTNFLRGPNHDFIDGWAPSVTKASFRPASAGSRSKTVPSISMA